jgi:hypothetical protein
MQASDPLIHIDPYPARLTCCEAFCSCLYDLCEKIKQLFNRIYAFFKRLFDDAPVEIIFVVSTTPPGGISSTKNEGKTPSPTQSDPLYNPDVTVDSIPPDMLVEMDKLNASTTPTPTFKSIVPAPKTPSPDSTRSIDSWEITSLNASPDKRKDS